MTAVATAPIAARSAFPARLGPARSTLAARLTPGSARRVAPPALAAALAVLGAIVGWRGTDLPAQLYRVTMFHRSGLALWDPGWFGGHWALAYSVLYPPVAATVGVTLTSVASAAGAALAFDRLVTGRFRRGAFVGSLLFAVGTTQQLAIGQLSFLMGEALALGACWAALRRRWALAAVLAAGASLTSPLAGAFLALAGIALVIAAAPRQRARTGVVLAGALVPIAVIGALFSDPGPFPFSFVDFTFDAGVAVALWVLAPKRLRPAAALYVAAVVACFALRNPVGGNVGRLAECLAIPFAACVLWPRRRVLLAVLAVPMALAVWGPAWGALTGRVARMPSAQGSYYSPLVRFLTADRGPSGRVEVVPTRYHWEAAYVAPSVPLARGWERQLDMARNPVFYSGRLDASTYRAWLLTRGVRFVAVPDAPLDMAGRAEARLVDAGVPGLTPVWGDAHWHVFAVDGAAGILSGPGRLVRMSDSRAVLDVTAPGALDVRVSAGRQWRATAGAACATASPDGVVVEARTAGRVELSVGFGTSRC